MRLGVGAVIVVVLLALAATVAIALFRGLGAPSEVVPLGESRETVESVVDGKASDRGTESDGDADAIITRGEVYVHVFGAIQAPGLYRLGEGARVVCEARAGLASPAAQVLPLVANIRCMQALGASERGAMGTSGRAYFDAHFEMTSQVRRLVELLNV